MKRYILYSLEVEHSTPQFYIHDVDYEVDKDYIENVYPKVFGIYKSEKSALSAKDNLKLEEWFIDEIDWEN